MGYGHYDLCLFLHSLAAVLFVHKNIKQRLCFWERPTGRRLAARAYSQ
jgi:hypothetical protein